MAYTPIAGNPANYPENVRAATGSDPRNATTEGALASDLADRTEYLKKRTVDRHVVNLGALQAITGVVSGDSVEVSGWGSYYYYPTTLTAVGDVILSATGMGVGSWVHDLRHFLFNSSDGGEGYQPKINPLFLGPQLIWTIPFTMALATNLSAQITATVLTTITQSAVEIGSLQVDDKLVGTLGPITVYNDASTGDARFVLSVQDNANGASPPAAVAEVNLYIEGTSTIHGPVGAITIPFQHTVAVAGAVRFTIRMCTGGSGAIWAHTFERDGVLGQISLYRG